MLTLGISLKKWIVGVLAKIGTDTGNRVAISYPYGAKSPHAVAALALCKKLGFKGALLEGCTDTGSVFVFKNTTIHKIEE